MDRIKKHAEKIKFAIVGGANTALDFLILFILVATGVNAIAANYVSTGVAFIFSFFVNKSFTFNNKSKKVLKQFVIFLVVTLFGLWVLQPLVIAGVILATEPLAWQSAAVLFIAKIIATLVSLVWNYLWYSKVVFKSA